MESAAPIAAPAIAPRPSAAPVRRAMPRELVGELRNVWLTTRLTPAQLRQRLREIAVEPGFTVAEQTRTLSESLARYRKLQRMAVKWAADSRSHPEGDVGRLVGEILKTMAASVAQKIQTGKRAVHPAQVATLARALKDIEAGAKTRLEIETRVRDRLRAELAGKRAAGADAVGEVARSEGLSSEAEAKIRAVLLGIDV